jgi:hypothetical protein
MQLTDIWQQYDFYTKGVTESSRKLAFATAAICCFFKTPEVTFPLPVLVSLALVIIFFFMDLLQYFLAALLRRFWARSQERKMWVEQGSINHEIQQPPWLDTPAFMLFICKILFLFGSFGSLTYEFYLRYQHIGRP